MSHALRYAEFGAPFESQVLQERPDIEPDTLSDLCMEHESARRSGFNDRECMSRAIMRLVEAPIVISGPRRSVDRVNRKMRRVLAKAVLAIAESGEGRP